MKCELEYELVKEKDVPGKKIVMDLLPAKYLVNGEDLSVWEKLEKSLESLGFEYTGPIATAGVKLDGDMYYSVSKDKKTAYAGVYYDKFSVTLWGNKGLMNSKAKALKEMLFSNEIIPNPLLKMPKISYAKTYARRAKLSA